MSEKDKYLESDEGEQAKRRQMSNEGTGLITYKRLRFIPFDSLTEYLTPTWLLNADVEFQSQTSPRLVHADGTLIFPLGMFIIYQIWGVDHPTFLPYTRFQEFKRVLRITRSSIEFHEIWKMSMNIKRIQKIFQRFKNEIFLTISSIGHTVQNNCLNFQSHFIEGLCNHFYWYLNYTYMKIQRHMLLKIQILFLKIQWHQYEKIWPNENWSLWGRSKNM